MLEVVGRLLSSQGEDDCVRRTDAREILDAALPLLRSIGNFATYKLRAQTFWTQRLALCESLAQRLAQLCELSESSTEEARALLGTERAALVARASSLRDQGRGAEALAIARECLEQLDALRRKNRAAADAWSAAWLACVRDLLEGYTLSSGSAEEAAHLEWLLSAIARDSERCDHSSECFFEEDAATVEEVQRLYPFIAAVGGADLGSVSVKDGCVHLTAESSPWRSFGRAMSHRIHPGADQRYSKVTFSINVTCNGDRYNVGLGVSVGDGTLRVVFHPGMHAGQLRVEGTREFAYNQNMCFTPLQWEKVHRAPRGERGSRLAVTLTTRGDHSVSITDLSVAQGSSCSSETFAWHNHALWLPDTPSPNFGLYGGDIGGCGEAIYEHFKAEFE